MWTQNWPQHSPLFSFILQYGFPLSTIPFSGLESLWVYKQLSTSVNYKQSFSYGRVESFCAVSTKKKNKYFEGVDDFGATIQKWRFPGIGVPLVIIYLNGIFLYNPWTKTIYWGTPMTMEPKSIQAQVVDAWLSVATRSLAGLAGLTGLPLLQALGATAKAGDLPLPLGFPLKSLGRVFFSVFQDILEGFHMFSPFFSGFSWLSLMIFRMFFLGTQDNKNLRFLFSFQDWFLGGQVFKDLQTHKWQPLHMGILRAIWTPKKGITQINRSGGIQKRSKNGFRTGWSRGIASNPPFFWGDPPFFWGIRKPKTQKKDPAFLTCLRLGGVGPIDAFIQESEKSLATHVGLFSLQLGPGYGRHTANDETFQAFCWNSVGILLAKWTEKEICFHPDTVSNVRFVSSDFDDLESPKFSASCRTMASCADA